MKSFYNGYLEFIQFKALSLDAKSAFRFKLGNQQKHLSIKILKGLSILVLLCFYSGSILFAQTKDFSPYTKLTEANIHKTLKENAQTIQFMENKGQVPIPGLLYYFQSKQGTVLLMKDKIRFVANDVITVERQSDVPVGLGEEPIKETEDFVTANHSFSMDFLDANPEPTVKIGEKFGTKFNYLLGDDPKGWVTGVQASKEVIVENLYKGISLRLYSTDKGSLEFDWIIDAGADYRDINMRFDGQDKLKVEKDGSLKVELRFTDVKFNIPESYQVTEEGKQTVLFSFVKSNNNTVSFHTKSKIDPNLPLVIDPTLLWGTYMDMNTHSSPYFDQYLYAVELDTNDRVLYCGGATNWNIPTNAPPYDANGWRNTITGLNGQSNPLPSYYTSVLYRINFNGSDLMDLTLFGPNNISTNQDNRIHSLSLSPTRVFVGGLTNAMDIPTTAGAFDVTRSGNDCFAAVFSKNLDNLIYGTYLGSSGNDINGVTSIKALSDTSFICGFTVVADLPAAYDGGPGWDLTYTGGQDFFMMKFSPLNTMNWGTYLGGTGNDVFNDLAVFPDGRVAFTGWGTSTLSEVNGAATTRSTGGNNDGFLGILSANGTSMLFLDEMGGANNDRLFDVEVYDDYLYYVGAVGSGFPVSASGVYDATYNGGTTDALIGRYRIDGTQYRSTFFGSTNPNNSIVELANALKQVTPVSCPGDTVQTFLLVWGTINGSGMPVKNLNGEPFYDPTHNGGTDMFFAGFTQTLDTLIYSTYIGGTNNDYLGDIGEPKGSNHLFVYGSDIYVGTTIHSTQASTSPNIIGGGPPGGFDQSKSNLQNDSHVIFSLGLTSIIQTDYGDADFGFTPYHTIDCENLKMGLLDSEASSTITIDARGDNNTGINDEQAVPNPPCLAPGNGQTITVTVDSVFNNIGTAATLYGWINFNGNTRFELWERTTVNVPNGHNGPLTLTWNNADVVMSPSMYLRIRLTTNVLPDDPATTTQDEAAYVPATNGEIEEYRLVVLQCPDPGEVDACLSPTELQDAFDNWLATAEGMGGCNGTLTNDNSGPPSACGGTDTITFTFVSTCAPLSCSCTSTFTVGDSIGAPAVDVICPANRFEAACQTQAAINSKYQIWLDSAMVEGGCSPDLTNNSTGPPNACGGIRTVTFTGISACGDSAMCTRTFEVDSGLVTLTCPMNVTEDACQTQDSITAKFEDWLQTVDATGGCNMVITDNSLEVPDRCGGSVSVTFTVTSSCDNSKTCTATFTVTTDEAPEFTGSLDTLFVDGCEASDAPDPATNVPDLEDLPGDLNVTDDCTSDEGLIVNSSDESEGSCPIYITRTYEITDSCNNVLGGIVQIIVIQDTTKPTFTKPADTTIYADANCDYDTDPATTGEVEDEMDNCTSMLEATYQDSVATGTCEGTTIIYRSWMLEDECENQADTQVQIITVLDTILPTFTIPADITIYKSPDIPDTTVIINYDFNGFTSYANLCAQIFDGIEVEIDTSSNPFLQNNQGTISGALAYRNNPNAGNAMVVEDSDLPGYWQFNVKGRNLPYGSRFGVHVQAFRNDLNSADSLKMQYSTDGAIWNTFRTRALAVGSWTQDTATMPAAVANLDSLFIRITYSGGNPSGDRSLFIDNFQVRADICCGYDASPNITGDVEDEMDNCSTNLLAVFCDSIVVEPCDGSNLIYRSWMLKDSCGNMAEPMVQLITVLDTTPPVFDVPNDTTLYKGTAISDTNVIVNYNFNRGRSYSELRPRLYYGISASIDTISSNVFLTDTGTITGLLAFATDSFVGRSLRVDTSDVYGHWQFHIGGDYLPLCSDFEVYVQTLKKGPGAADTCHLDYSVDSINWFRFHSFPLTLGVWVEDTATVPTVGLGTDSLYIRVTYSGPIDTGDAALCIDNFQIRAMMHFDTCAYDPDPQWTGWPENLMDNCDKHPALFYRDSITNGETCSDEILITRIWYAYDDCNNIDSAIQLITILDTLQPIINCPEDVTVDCEGSTHPDSTGYAEGFEYCTDSMLMVDWMDEEIPGECVGDYTIVRTWTVTDACDNTNTCEQIITVIPRPGPIITCPNDTILASCLTDAEIASEFEDWLDRVEVSGGCNTTYSDDNTGPPDRCGGTVTVTFSAISDCLDDYDCTASFTVEDAPEPMLTCPADVTVASCQTQDSVDNQFDDWLETVMSGGGCEPMLTNSGGSAPDRCGGLTSVTFTLSSGCESDLMCTAIFTVEDAEEVMLTCPVDQTTAACQSQGLIDTLFGEWLEDAMFTGGCNGSLSNDAGAAPDYCGGSVTVTFTVSSDCESDVICTATFTVEDAPEVMLTCPVDQTEDACQTQDEINTKFDDWLNTAMVSGGCNTMMTNDGAMAPDYCGGSVTVTFNAESDCEDDVTCTATFTVEDATDVMLTCPPDQTEDACQTQAEIDTKFNDWLNTVMVTGGCDAQITHDAGPAPDACGGEVVVTFTASSDCADDMTCMATFTVEEPDDVMLTCPTDQMEDACQTQAEIDTKFNDWLNTVMVSGGCDAQITNDAGPAPDACGGEVVVTFTASSDCADDMTCMATFTVIEPDEVMLTCPTDQIEDTCQTQDEINTKFNDWLNTAMVTGGCNTQITNDAGAAPDACGGEVVVTFTASSDCEDDVTCTATFTVEEAEEVMLTCPPDQTEDTCQTQDEINTKFEDWLDMAMVTGGCNTQITNDGGAPPDACGGSTTVTWTASSDCEADVTCTATFTVEDAPDVMLTCPPDQTEMACQTQGEIDTKFNDWLGDAMVSGGCNTMLSNSGGTPPDACGGSTTVTWTASSDCEGDVTCTATFTVEDATDVMLTCPPDQTEMACQLQSEIDTKFNDWLGDATVNGGCNAMVTNDGGTPPDACGGSTTVTWTASSDCEGDVTCTATFTVEDAPDVMLTCPPDQTEMACQTQGEIDTKFNDWLSDASYSGGCNAMITNDGGTPPDACGGSATVTWTVSSDCEGDVSCTATFTVEDATDVMLTCPPDQTEMACQTQGEIDTKFNDWLGDATVNGGCNAMITNDGGTPPDACGGSATVTWTVSSDCEDDVTCTATFTVEDAPDVMLTCPPDQMEDACQTQAEIDTKFNDWLGDAMYSGGCNAMITNDGGTPPDACGGTTTVTWTVSSDCEDDVTCTANFVVEEPDDVMLSCPSDRTEPACQDQATIDQEFNDWLGEAMYSGGCNAMISNSGGMPPDACGGTTSVTWTVSSDCEDDVTCTASFTVETPDAVMLTCPPDETVMACMTQSEIDMQFNDWLGDAMVSGGCNTMLSNSGGTPPDACGGSTTVTWTASSDCEADVTCTATFTVEDAPDVMLTCPPDQTEMACQTQGEIDTKFNDWLGDAMVSGGCNTMLSNSGGTPPDACGGSTTVTWTASSDCEGDVTCTATFTVEDATDVMLTCPPDQTEMACQLQSEIDTKFNDWLGDATVNGGCNAMVTNDGGTPPDACGGSTTVTWTASSDCEGDVSCTATFTVEDAPDVMLTCPPDQTEMACQTQGEIDTKFNDWLSDASYSGGCNAMITNDGGTPPDACGGSATVTWTVSSDCEGDVSCTATFTVEDATDVMLTCPPDQTEMACQTQGEIDTKFNDWLGDATVNGGCNAMITNDGGTPPDACGGSATVTWTVSSDCEDDVTCTATFTVEDAPDVMLTCPPDQMEDACQTQAEIDTKFNDWLGDAMYSGGCNAMITNDGGTPPDACGGTTTVTWTVSSDCEDDVTCTANFVVEEPDDVMLSCPSDRTEPACQDQATIDQEFNDWLGEAMYSGGCNAMISNSGGMPPDACGGTTSVTWTVSSDCEDDVTCTASFTVETPDAVMLTCPPDETVMACMTQSEIDMQFNDWLGDAMVSGGCNTMLSNSGGAPPDACGGSTTVTWTASSDCEADVTCTATFTVEDAPDVMLTCPPDQTEMACQTQGEIDTKFNDWLGDAMVSGGCNTMLSNSGGTPPDACGGSTTVTWTASSDCEADVTCTATFTVEEATDVMLTCPPDQTEMACQLQSEIDTKFNDWLGDATVNGGCNAMVTNDGGTPPDACGGSTTVTWTASSDCEGDVSCTATFTVEDAPDVMLTCPPDQTEMACQTQGEIDTKFNDWLSDASYSGGCNAMITNDGGTPPDACGGSATVTWTVSSDCEGDVSCTATFTVEDATDVMLTCPPDQTEMACQTQGEIDTKFNDWLGDATVNGGCNAMITNDGGTPPDACGGSATVTWTVSSDCEDDVTCTATFTVEDAPDVMLTCPPDQMEDACQTQAEIDTKFNDWLGDAMYSGGCNAMITNDGGTPPDACGGTTTVTWTVSSDCEDDVTCTANFVVEEPDDVMLSCPSDRTEPACQDQATIDQEFNDWLGEAMYSGGCNAMISNSGGMPPDACGGTTSVTWTVSSDCEDDVTCTASFTVETPDAVMLTCPPDETVMACMTQSEIDMQFNDWLGDAMVSGGCNTMLSNSGGAPPDACGGSTTVTWTASSDCEDDVTCTATFTVEDAPDVMLTCPPDQTEMACQTQGEIDTKFNDWLGDAMVSGGCNTMLSNSGGTPPDACGGSTTVTWTASSDCEADVTCTATFTVEDATDVMLTCPPDQTEMACQLQSEIDTKFNDWLGDATVNGGCNAMVTNDGGTPPDACGGSTTVTWTASSDCEGDVSCTATFTVEDAPDVMLTCPPDQTEMACQTQGEIDTKFNDWLSDASYSGGCNAMITNDGGTPPDACGGSATVTWTVSSDCEGDVSCTATFTVEDATDVMLTCPPDQTEMACQTQGEIDTKFNDWLGDATVNGGCNAMITNDGGTPPDACGGSATVTWTVSSDCEDDVTCTATFTVEDAPDVMLTCPPDQMEDACQTQAEIDTKFNDWLGDAMYSGGCNAMITNDGGTPPDACGGTTTVTWTVSSDCEDDVTCTANFVVEEPDDVMLSCPSDRTEPACQDQATIDQEFNDWLGEAMYSGGCNAMISNSGGMPPDACGGTTSVTWTVSSDCEDDVTCTASFTVETPDAVMLTCPPDETVMACMTQSEIDMQFNDWLGDAMVSGGCNTMLSNSGGAPPDACGGSTTVTWTASSDCEADVTCTATFTVEDAPDVMLTCPPDQTEMACQTQGEIDTKFNDWLGDAMVSGGCNTMLSNSGGTPPDACGGSTTVTWTASSDCEGDVTCTATFTVEDATDVMLTCPPDQTEMACQLQSEIDTKFNDWLGDATVNGGCNAMVTNDGGTPPDACGGSTTVTWTASSDCEGDVSCTATFTVEDAPDVMLTCPPDQTEMACQTQGEIDTKFNDWLSDASYSGGCNAMITNDGGTPPDACGGSATVIWTVSSDCEGDVSCTATFTVEDAPDVMLTCPPDQTEMACQTQGEIDTKFNNWLDDAMYSGGCNAMITNDGGTPPDACGETRTVTWTVSSDCEDDVTCTATFTVEDAPDVMLTCPLDQIEPACQDQATIDQEFNDWLGDAMYSGGCNAMISNDGGTPPDACGGTTTVTWTVSSDCEDDVTCTANFVVEEPDDVMLSCPSDRTEPACQDQATIDQEFNDWLGEAMYSGGCNAMISNSGGMPPDACGGTTSVTWTVSSDCEDDVTCTASFTVETPDAVMLTCPPDETVMACMTQSEIDMQFNDWLGDAMVSGGCNTMLSNSGGAPPDACGGSTTVTWTASSDCEGDVTCTATFTVEDAPAVMLTCPVDQIEMACQTQAEIDSKFNIWINSAMVNGGCNPMLSNTGGSAPDACGGNISINFTVTSDCEDPVMCTAMFTVEDPGLVMLTCPADRTEVACQDQTMINQAFSDWLNDVNVNGGCNVILTNDNTGAPDACGGNTTVSWTASSDCEADVMCSATFTVEDAPDVMLTCPLDQTELECQTQATINQKFNDWLNSANVSGGCNPVLSDNNTGAPNACGGTTTVTFTVNSDCEMPMTCSASFTVMDAPALSISCPMDQMELACQTQSEINNKFNIWLASVSFNGGCNTMVTNNNTGAPDACGGTTTVLFTATSECGAMESCSATFTVDAAPPVDLDCPADQMEIACQDQATIDQEFNDWLNDAVFSGGCNAMISNNGGSAPDACGGTATVTWTVSSDCENDVTCSATFTVEDAPDIMLTCPPDHTEVNCQSQASIDLAFADWLDDATFSGGCNAMISNSGGMAPDACGGTTSVTWTVTSDCEDVTCTATFTVEDSPPVDLDCPADHTELACQDQVDIDQAFDDWLDDAMFSGGCNATISNSGGSAPDECGGTTSVTWTVSSDCENDVTCTATFTVEDAPDVMLNCPSNQTEASCQNQSAIDGAFASWLNTANFTGGCDANMSNNNSGAPNFCGGTTTVTFTVNSSCEGPVTCMATFTVTDAPNVNLNCPINTNSSNCPSQAVLDAEFAAWLNSANFTGGCNGMLSNNNSGPPPICGGNTTVVFTVTSDCESSVTCSATFTVPTPAPVMFTCPSDQTEAACQSQGSINAAFANWLNAYSVSGGCNTMVSNNNSGAPNFCGGTTTVVFTVSSSCENSATCSASFTVNNAPAVNFTCVMDQTEAACQTQAEIDSRFNTWLNSYSVNGGCNTMVSNNNSGAPSFCGGTTTVVFTVTSDCENSTTCSATFTVLSSPLSLTCPPDITEEACQTRDEILEKFDDWVATANVTGGCNPILTTNDFDFPNECGGTVQIIFTVTSDCDVPKTCTANFIVTPMDPPVIECPDDVTIECNTGTNPLNTGFPEAFDGCDGTPDLSYDDQIIPGMCPGEQEIIRSWTAIDLCSQLAECVQMITVENNLPPTFDYPPDITIYKGEFAAGNKLLVNYTFNEGVTYESLAPFLHPGITSEVDTSSVMYMSFIPGVVTGPLAFSLNSIAGKSLKVNNSSLPGHWQFNIGGRNLPAFQNFEVYVQARRHSNGSATNLVMDYSTNGVNWTTFSNTLLTQGVWTECTNPITGVNNPSQLWIRVRWSGGTNNNTQELMIDNFQLKAIKNHQACEFDESPSITGFPSNIQHPCDGNPSATYRDSVALGDCESKVYRTWIVTDNCGNTSSGNGPQVITALDTTGPIITCPSVNVLVRKADTMDCFYTVIGTEFDAIASDLCQDSVSLINNYNFESTLEGERIPVGLDTIRWTATDACGNTSICDLKIEIYEIEPPVAVCMNITIHLDQTGKDTITVWDVDGGSTDNCGIKTRTLSREIFDCDDIPFRTVILKVIDSSGLEDTCHAILTIRDTIPPNITCKNLNFALPQSKMRTITPLEVLLSNTDNCGVLTRVVNPNMFNCDSPKQTVVTVRVTDVNGNSSTCTATVTITNDSDGDGVYDPCDNCIDFPNEDQADSDCDTVGDECDVCPGGDDSVDNNGDGLPDCKFPPSFAQIKSDWKCGTVPQRVVVADIANGSCTRRCILYTTYLSTRGPNRHLGPCKSCSEGLDDTDPNNDTAEKYDDTDRTDVSALVDFRIVPNPNEGIFDIEFDQIVDEGSIKIFNLLGREIYSLNIDKSTQRIRIDESLFVLETSGIYRIVLVTNNVRKVHNMMIISK
ncbi:MAG: T9SS type A sorting domain-containing protein [Saprospiraceae bacterium]|nr:T9SS type A sorting domain-containing protein [Saprospiraceae bacterium]